MTRKLVLPVLAIAGIGIATYVVILNNKSPKLSDPVTQPARSPFATYVAGAGLIEALTENISIGAPVGEIVTEVCVKISDKVKKGDALFKLDDRTVKAEHDSRKSAVESAMAQKLAAEARHKGALARLEKLKSMPRPEDIPPAQSRVLEAQALVDDAMTQLKLYESVKDTRAVSQDELDRRRFAVRVAETKLATSKADLELLKAGAWKADIEIALAEALSAEADVKSADAAIMQAKSAADAAMTEIERRVVRAPVDGTILQVKIRVGEFAQPGPLQTPLMVMGQTDTLVARVDVDENDAWRVNSNAKAIASVRGNPQMRAELVFYRLEPYVIPKKSLTGDSMERVDTRVLQVLYKLDPTVIPVRVGQQVDVFIEAAPSTAGNPAR